MPLAKSLHKVTKKLSKQSAGALHVKGRKFKQLNRATEREHKLHLKKTRFAEQKNHELLFYLHIQESINERSGVETLTVDDMRQIIQAYIDRNDEDLERMNSERRPGRPMTNKHQIMLEKKKYDEHIFETGFKIPDLRDRETADRLRNWNGTSGSASSWKWTFVTKNPQNQEAAQKDENMM